MGRKKIILLVLLNIVIFIGMAFLLNWVIYKYFYAAIENNQFKVNDRPYNLKRYNLDYDTIKSFYPIRGTTGENFKRNGIIIFGCSYGYGAFLEMEQTFGYKLSQMLKRPVYNYAASGQSPQFAIIRIRSHELDDIIKKSDYAIYVTIGEHVWRTRVNSNGFHYEAVWPRMIIKKVHGEKKLVRYWAKFPSIEGSYLVKYIKKIWFAKILTPLNIKFVQNYMFDFAKLHYLTINKELKEINPNIKMIVLVYHDEEETELFTSSSRWSELEQEGITVIDVNKCLPQLRQNENGKYTIPNDGHPSEAAWNDITDLFVNELKVID